MQLFDGLIALTKSISNRLHDNVLWSSFVQRGRTDEEEVIVVDIGSHTIKAGFAGADAPTAVFRNIIGLPKYPFGMSLGHVTIQR